MGELVEKLADAESELEAKNAEVDQLHTNLKHLTEASEIKSKEFEQLRKEFDETKTKLDELQKIANENAEKLSGKEEEVKSLQQQITGKSEEKEADKVLEIANLQSTVASKWVERLISYSNCQ